MKRVAVLLSLFLVLGCRSHACREEAPLGTVLLSVVEEGNKHIYAAGHSARILVDGRFIGMYGRTMSIPLSPGEHTIRAEADGYPPVEGTIHVLAGSEGQRLQLRVDD